MWAAKKAVEREFGSEFQMAGRMDILGVEERGFYWVYKKADSRDILKVAPKDV